MKLSNANAAILVTILTFVNMSRDDANALRQNQDRRWTMYDDIDADA